MILDLEPYPGPDMIYEPKLLVVGPISSSRLTSEYLIVRVKVRTSVFSDFFNCNPLPNMLIPSGTIHGVLNDLFVNQCETLHQNHKESIHILTLSNRKMPRL